ncbi:MAG: restriction endonuclease subunit S [Desulfotignum sp.]|nr:restriction endonuclease subunit S [Desulfotignum sp.]
MSKIAGWNSTTIGYHLELINGYAFPSDRFTEGEGIPLIRIRDLNRHMTEVNYRGDYSERYVVKKGDLLVGMDGDFSTTQWKGGDSLLNQRVCKLVTKDKEQLEQDFLFFRIIEEIKLIHRITAATTVKHLSSRDILDIEIELPPILEQSKIAEVLSTVDRAIEQTEGLIAKQQRIKTGLMQDLLSRGIDENGNLRSEEIHEFKDSPIGRIPVEWDMQALGELSQISSGITLGKTHAGSNTIELPYLRVANVQDSFLDLSDVRTIRVPTSYVEKYQLHVGDVLMNEGGDFDKLGRGAVWHGEIDICLHQNHVFKVRPKEGKLSSNFLANVSASPYGKAFFILASKQSTNLASINSTQLKGFLVPLPSYREQIEIEKIISGNEETIKIYQAELNKLLYFKRALMQDLLTGKVRVTPLLETKEITL